MHDKIDIGEFRIRPGQKLTSGDLMTSWSGPPPFDALAGKKLKKHAREFLEQQRAELSDVQERLYASDTHSVLIVFQGRDAAGKDSAIKHIMSGVDPAGCQVVSFKAPSAEELDHNYLWRCWKAVPERGRIGIFNRSHYEEVLVVRVHPAILANQRLPERLVTEHIWQERYEDINAFERHLARNGTVIIKLFLNVSFAEQRNRFIERLTDPEKAWKFSARDVAERKHWDDYDVAICEMLAATSTEHAPWYVVPSDDQWVSRALAAHIITETLEGLRLERPQLSGEERAKMADSLKSLKAERV
ncbi:MAG: polyphosphate kinase 2 family protein [Rhizobiales bacterium]|nr:polyphosphate kinase 2 family protein [Hyphomicrobiales bacterium]